MMKKILIIFMVIFALGFTTRAFMGATNFDRLVLGSANYDSDPNTTADITLQNDEYMTNVTDGTIDFGAANLTTTGAVSGALPSASAVVFALPGAIQVSTTGTDTAPVDGKRFYTVINIPFNQTVTGIFFQIGSVGGTDSVYAELYNSAGTLVKTSTKAIVGTAANIQKCVFAASYSATAGKFYIALQFNGNTARLRTHTAASSPFVADTIFGTFGTAKTITFSTTYTSAVAPYCGVY